MRSVSHSSDEEALFFARLQDMFDTVERRCVPKFTAFLDESQVFRAKSYLESRRLENWMLWGGAESTVRRMLGIFPDYMEPEIGAFPIKPLTVTYRRVDTLTHRDFLGSLMGLQIKREAVGDILVSEGSCVLFVTDKVEQLICSELQKIGRVGVKVERGILSSFPTEQQLEEQPGTVASLRLDCIVSLLTGKSREKAAELIRIGAVFLNYREAQSNSASVEAGDIITVRGFGKAKLGEEIRKTKKDRYYVVLQKYV